MRLPRLGTPALALRMRGGERRCRGSRKNSHALSTCKVAGTREPLNNRTAFSANLLWRLPRHADAAERHLHTDQDLTVRTRLGERSRERQCEQSACPVRATMNTEERLQLRGVPYPFEGESQR